MKDAAWLPEYENNPFTKVLGPPPDFARQYEILEAKPDFDPAERKLPHHLRRHAVLRLFDIMAPLERQVDAVERVHMIVRQGYKARDPAKGLHKRQFLASASAIERFAEGLPIDEATSLIAVEHGSAAVGFALLGDPGMGKTRTVGRILASLPRIARPEGLPYEVVQLPYLKVEAPSTGGRRALCIDLITAVDEVLGTNYVQTFVKSKVTTERLMLHAQHLANLHAIGLLVIDEVQHLLLSRDGVKPVMNFLVTLVNRLGIPVMLIGTNEARPVIEGSFRNARRAMGLGQLNWPRLRRGEEWDDWLAQVWGYQWTKVETPLTPDLSEAMFDECQGVIDVAMKLFLLTQFRAILNNEVRDLPEIITPELIRAIAKEEFMVIAPMIQAMRDGRDDVLAAYPDLEDFHAHINRLLAGDTNMAMDEFRQLRALRERVAEARRESAEAPWMGLKAGLLTRGHAPEVVDRVIAEAIRRNAADDLLGMADTINMLLETEPKPTRKPPVKRAVKAPPAGSIQDIGRAAAGDVHAKMAAAGMISTLDDVLSA
ncbi:ATP-binding protein [Sphingomonas melonis]